jgi:hypothetical protein
LRCEYQADPALTIAALASHAFPSRGTCAQAIAILAYGELSSSVRRRSESGSGGIAQIA